jgi:hypothetical protein
MQEELDDFENCRKKQKNYKLLIDFNKTNLNLDKKSMEINNIKYKTRKKLNKETIVKNKSKNNLFNE